MTAAVQITYRNMNASESIQELIREKADKLRNHYDGMTECRVTIERPHRRHETGNLFEVHIETSFGGRAIVVSRNHEAQDEHEEPQPAIRDAFAAAERQLQEAKDRLTHHVKSHSR